MMRSWSLVRWAVFGAVVAALWVWIVARLVDGFADACGRAVGM